MIKTEKEEFIDFITSNPEELQIIQPVPNKVNKNMKNTSKTNAKSTATVTKTAKVKPTKIKVEGGLEIIRGLAIPESSSRRGIKSPIRKTLESLQVGDAFDTDKFEKQHRALQYKLGIKLQTQDLGDGKTRVFRKA